MAGFISLDQLESALTATLNVAELASASSWDVILPWALSAAQGDIVAALQDRGFTASQINSWDRARDFSEAIALYHALVRGAVGAGYDLDAAKLHDWRPQLATVAVTINGKVVQPGASTGGGGVRSGTLSNDNDLFPAARRNSPYLSGWWR